MFGYSGPLYKQKDNIIKLTVKYNIRIIKYKNDEYQIFLNNCDMVVDDVDFSQLYPPITRTQLKSKPTHILIMPQDLKKLFYVVDTKNGNMLREFFVKFDELLIIYSDYCVAYNNEHQPIKKLYTPKNELSPLNYISIESEPVDKDVCCSCSIQ
jgi:hypothetical protein